MINGLTGLERHFWTMEKIDKLQFPLPYAQVVKILVVIYVFAFPFTIAHACGMYTLPITLLVSMGFFGLDEVAEILESPFSSDPNAINLRDFAPRLVRDLDIMFHDHKGMKDIALDKTNFDERRLYDRWEEYRKNKGENLAKALWRKTKTFTRSLTGLETARGRDAYVEPTTDNFRALEAGSGNASADPITGAAPANESADAPLLND
jgi:predicted membrane chloride channel (bestrophin family)